ncbi:hypothetical protein MVEN_00000200 [Mycena venus]|uniref:Uncharacterized protein n=1 Tax=Mycena venus TaxID=2733690 RepID=A0A8H6Z5Q4_9AGAR|nr:hypothetical protein MVEN_00000200 [Mycena venus]
MPPKKRSIAATAPANLPDTLTQPPPPPKKVPKKATKKALAADSEYQQPGAAPRARTLRQALQHHAQTDLDDSDFPEHLALPKAAICKAPATQPQGNESDFEEAAPTKRRRGALKVDPRSLLPGCKKRVKNPGAPDMPKKVRTPAEVAQIKRQKVKKLQEIEELHAQKVAQLAEMEVDEEDADAEHDSLVIKSIADLEKMDTAEYAALIGSRMDDELAWALDNFQPSDDDMPYSPGLDTKYIGAISAALNAVNEAESPELVRVSKPKKKVKGAIRDDVDTVKEKIRSKKDGNRLEKMQALYPTALEADWRQRITSRGYNAEPGTSSAKSTSGGSNLRAIPQQAGLGDLSDDDGDGIKPATRAKFIPFAGRAATTVQGKKRNQNRANDEIFFVLDSDDEAPGPSSRVPVAPKKKAVIKSEAARPKLEPQSSVTIVSTPSPAPGPDTIPAVVAAAWDNAWIPTLLHLLGSRENPWEITDEEIEDAFTTVFPGVVYNLKASGNLVMKRSRDRLNNGRSWFPTQAFLFVSKRFVEAFPDATPNEKKALIAAYVKYALRPNGPMLFLHPESEFLKKNDHGYQSASGMCKSKFVIGVFAPFVKKTANFRKDYGLLASGLALSNAALEKVFLMYQTGEYISDKTQFSCENVGSLVDDYLENINKFSQRKWDAILNLCGAAVNIAPPVSAPSMEVSRRVLYVSSSPVKGNDSE